MTDPDDTARGLENPYRQAGPGGTVRRLLSPWARRALAVGAMGVGSSFGVAVTGQSAAHADAPGPISRHDDQDDPAAENDAPNVDRGDGDRPRPLALNRTRPDADRSAASKPKDAAAAPTQKAKPARPAPSARADENRSAKITAAVLKNRRDAPSQSDDRDEPTDENRSRAAMQSLSAALAKAKKPEQTEAARPPAERESGEARQRRQETRSGEAKGKPASPTERGQSSSRNRSTGDVRSDVKPTATASSKATGEAPREEAGKKSEPRSERGQSSSSDRSGGDARSDSKSTLAADSSEARKDSRRDQSGPGQGSASGQGSGSAEAAGASVSGEARQRRQEARRREIAESKRKLAAFGGDDRPKEVVTPEAPRNPNGPGSRKQGPAPSRTLEDRSGSGEGSGDGLRDSAGTLEDRSGSGQGSGSGRGSGSAEAAGASVSEEARQRRQKAHRREIAESKRKLAAFGGDDRPSEVVTPEAPRDPNGPGSRKQGPAPSRTLEDRLDSGGRDNGDPRVESAQRPGSDRLSNRQKNEIVDPSGSDRLQGAEESASEGQPGQRDRMRDSAPKAWNRHQISHAENEGPGSGGRKSALPTEPVGGDDRVMAGGATKSADRKGDQVEVKELPDKPVRETLTDTETSDAPGTTTRVESAGLSTADKSGKSTKVELAGVSGSDAGSVPTPRPEEESGSDRGPAPSSKVRDRVWKPTKSADGKPADEKVTGLTPAAAKKASASSADARVTGQDVVNVVERTGSDDEKRDPSPRGSMTRAAGDVPTGVRSDSEVTRAKASGSKASEAVTGAKAAGSEAVTEAKATQTGTSVSKVRDGVLRPGGKASKTFERRTTSTPVGGSTGTKPLDTAAKGEGKTEDGSVAATLVGTPLAKVKYLNKYDGKPIKDGEPTPTGATEVVPTTLPTVGADDAVPLPTPVSVSDDATGEAPSTGGAVREPDGDKTRAGAGKSSYVDDEGNWVLVNDRGAGLRVKRVTKKDSTGKAITVRTVTQDNKIVKREVFNRPTTDPQSTDAKVTGGKVTAGKTTAGEVAAGKTTAGEVAGGEVAEGTVTGEKATGGKVTSGTVSGEKATGKDRTEALAETSATPTEVGSTPVSEAGVKVEAPTVSTVPPKSGADAATDQVTSYVDDKGRPVRVKDLGGGRRVERVTEVGDNGKPVTTRSVLDNEKVVKQEVISESGVPGSDVAAGSATGTASPLGTGPEDGEGVPDPSMVASYVDDKGDRIVRADRGNGLIVERRTGVNAAGERFTLRTVSQDDEVVKKQVFAADEPTGGQATDAGPKPTTGSTSETDGDVTGGSIEDPTAAQESTADRPLRAELRKSEDAPDSRPVPLPTPVDQPERPNGDRAAKPWNRHQIDHAPDVVPGSRTQDDGRSGSDGTGTAGTSVADPTRGDALEATSATGQVAETADGSVANAKPLGTPLAKVKYLNKYDGKELKDGAGTSGSTGDRVLVDDQGGAEMLSSTDASADDVVPESGAVLAQGTAVDPQAGVRRFVDANGNKVVVNERGGGLRVERSTGVDADGKSVTTRTVFRDDKVVKQEVFDRQGKAVATEVADATVTDARATDAKVTDAKVTDAKVTDAKVTDAKVTDAKVTDAKVTDAKVTDAKVTDAKVTDAKVTDAKATDRKADLGEGVPTEDGVTVGGVAGEGVVPTGSQPGVQRFVDANGNDVVVSDRGDGLQVARVSGVGPDGKPVTMRTVLKDGKVVKQQVFNRPGTPGATDAKSGDVETGDAKAVTAEGAAAEGATAEGAAAEGVVGADQQPGVQRFVDANGNDVVVSDRGDGLQVARVSGVGPNGKPVTMRTVLKDGKVVKQEVFDRTGTAGTADGKATVGDTTTGGSATNAPVMLDVGQHRIMVGGTPSQIRRAQTKDILIAPPGWTPGKTTAFETDKGVVLVPGVAGMSSEEAARLVANESRPQSAGDGDGDGKDETDGRRGAPGAVKILGSKVVGDLLKGDGGDVASAALPGLADLAFGNGGGLKTAAGGVAQHFVREGVQDLVKGAPGTGGLVDGAGQIAAGLINNGKIDWDGVAKGVVKKGVTELATGALGTNVAGVAGVGAGVLIDALMGKKFDAASTFVSGVAAATSMPMLVPAFAAIKLLSALDKPLSPQKVTERQISKASYLEKVPLANMMEKLSQGKQFTDVDDATVLKLKNWAKDWAWDINPNVKKAYENMAGTLTANQRKSAAAKQVEDYRLALAEVPEDQARFVVPKDVKGFDKYLGHATRFTDLKESGATPAGAERLVKLAELALGRSVTPKKIETVDRRANLAGVLKALNPTTAADLGTMSADGLRAFLAGADGSPALKAQARRQLATRLPKEKAEAILAVFGNDVAAYRKKAAAAAAPQVFRLPNRHDDGADEDAPPQGSVNPLQDEIEAPRGLSPEKMKDYVLVRNGSGKLMYVDKDRLDDEDDKRGAQPLKYRGLELVPGGLNYAEYLASRDAIPKSFTRKVDLDGQDWEKEVYPRLLQKNLLNDSDPDQSVYERLEAEKERQKLAGIRALQMVNSERVKNGLSKLTQAEVEKLLRGAYTGPDPDFYAPSSPISNEQIESRTKTDDDVLDQITEAFAELGGYIYDMVESPSEFPDGVDKGKSATPTVATTPSWTASGKPVQKPAAGGVAGRPGDDEGVLVASADLDMPLGLPTTTQVRDREGQVATGPLTRPNSALDALTGTSEDDAPAGTTPSEALDGLTAPPGTLGDGESGTMPLTDLDRLNRRFDKDEVTYSVTPSGALDRLTAGSGATDEVEYGTTPVADLDDLGRRYDKRRTSLTTSPSDGLDELIAGSGTTGETEYGTTPVADLDRITVTGPQFDKRGISVTSAPSDALDAARVLQYGTTPSTALDGLADRPNQGGYGILPSSDLDGLTDGPGQAGGTIPSTALDGLTDRPDQVQYGTTASTDLDGLTGRPQATRVGTVDLPELTGGSADRNGGAPLFVPQDDEDPLFLPQGGGDTPDGGVTVPVDGEPEGVATGTASGTVPGALAIRGGSGAQDSGAQDSGDQDSGDQGSGDQGSGAQGSGEQRGLDRPMQAGDRVSYGILPGTRDGYTEDGDPQDGQPTRVFLSRINGELVGEPINVSEGQINLSYNRDSRHPAFSVSATGNTQYVNAEPGDMPLDQRIISTLHDDGPVTIPPMVGDSMIQVELPTDSGTDDEGQTQLRVTCPDGTCVTLSASGNLTYEVPGEAPRAIVPFRPNGWSLEPGTGDADPNSGSTGPDGGDQPDGEQTVAEQPDGQQTGDPATDTPEEAGGTTRWRLGLSVVPGGAMTISNNLPNLRNVAGAPEATDPSRVAGSPYRPLRDDVRDDAVRILQQIVETADLAEHERSEGRPDTDLRADVRRLWGELDDLVDPHYLADRDNPDNQVTQPNLFNELEPIDVYRPSMVAELSARLAADEPPERPIELHRRYSVMETSALMPQINERLRKKWPIIANDYQGYSGHHQAAGNAQKTDELNRRFQQIGLGVGIASTLLTGSYNTYLQNRYNAEVADISQRIEQVTATGAQVNADRLFNANENFQDYLDREARGNAQRRFADGQELSQEQAAAGLQNSSTRFGESLRNDQERQAAQRIQLEGINALNDLYTDTRQTLDTAQGGNLRNQPTTPSGRIIPVFDSNGDRLTVAEAEARLRVQGESASPEELRRLVEEAHRQFSLDADTIRIPGLLTPLPTQQGQDGQDEQSSLPVAPENSSSRDLGNAAAGLVLGTLGFGRRNSGGAGEPAESEAAAGSTPPDPMSVAREILQLEKERQAALRNGDLAAAAALRDRQDAEADRLDLVRPSEVRLGVVQHVIGELERGPLSPESVPLMSPFGDVLSRTEVGAVSFHARDHIMKNDGKVAGALNVPHGTSPGFEHNHLNAYVQASERYNKLINVIGTAVGIGSAFAPIGYGVVTRQALMDNWLRGQNSAEITRNSAWEGEMDRFHERQRNALRRFNQSEATAQGNYELARNAQIRNFTESQNLADDIASQGEANAARQFEESRRRTAEEAAGTQNENSLALNELINGGTTVATVQMRNPDGTVSNYAMTGFSDTGARGIDNPVLATESGRHPRAVETFLNTNLPTAPIQEYFRQERLRNPGASEAQLRQNVLERLDNDYGDQIQRAANEAAAQRNLAPSSAQTAPDYEFDVQVIPGLLPDRQPTPSGSQAPSQAPGGTGPQSSGPSGDPVASAPNLGPAPERTGTRLSPGGVTVRPDFEPDDGTLGPNAGNQIPDPPSPFDRLGLPTPTPEWTPGTLGGYGQGGPDALAQGPGHTGSSERIDMEMPVLSFPAPNDNDSSQLAFGTNPDINVQAPDRRPDAPDFGSPADLAGNIFGLTGMERRPDGGYRATFLNGGVGLFDEDGNHERTVRGSVPDQLITQLQMKPEDARTALTLVAVPGGARLASGLFNGVSRLAPRLADGLTRVVPQVAGGAGAAGLVPIPGISGGDRTPEQQAEQPTAPPVAQSAPNLTSRPFDETSFLDEDGDYTTFTDDGSRIDLSRSPGVASGIVQGPDGSFRYQLDVNSSHYGEPTGPFGRPNTIPTERPGIGEPVLTGETRTVDGELARSLRELNRQDRLWILNGLTPPNASGAGSGGSPASGAGSGGSSASGAIRGGASAAPVWSAAEANAESLRRSGLPLCGGDETESSCIDPTTFNPGDPNSYGSEVVGTGGPTRTEGGRTYQVPQPAQAPPTRRTGGGSRAGGAGDAGGAGSNARPSRGRGSAGGNAGAPVGQGSGGGGGGRPATNGAAGAGSGGGNAVGQPRPTRPLRDVINERRGQTGTPNFPGGPR